MTETLRDAQLRRMGVEKPAPARKPDLDSELDRVLGLVFSADSVGPEARAKLKGILQHYAKEAHPFRACVRDNTKRFGPGRTEAICATIKDIIRGTTHWRGHPGEDHGSPGLTSSDIDSYTLTEEEKRLLLTRLSDDDMQAIEDVMVNAA